MRSVSEFGVRPGQGGRLGETTLPAPPNRYSVSEGLHARSICSATVPWHGCDRGFRKMANALSSVQSAEYRVRLTSHRLHARTASY
jgi:hypothetical protein